MGVRNAFVPPTALRMLKSVSGIRKRFRLDLRTIGSAGEALGRETYEWARGELGMTVNEFYGQTECNIVLSSCAALGVSRSGAIGKPLPGHEVAVIDVEGDPMPPGEIGQIAVRRPDPVMFLGYWENEKATREKFIGDWMTTGDQGIADVDGYVHFFGRDDDVITSAGFRIGPGRDRGLPDRTSGDRARGCRRQTRSAANRDRQGLCGVEGWRRRHSRTGGGNQGLGA